jgi:hypothetical protein
MVARYVVSFSVYGMCIEKKLWIFFSVLRLRSLINVYSAVIMWVKLMNERCT